MEGALSCPSVEGALSNCARPGSHPKGNCSQQDCQDAVGRGGGLGGTQEPGSCCCRCHVPGGWRAQVHLLEGFLTPNPALRELVEGRQACQGAGRWGAPRTPSDQKPCRFQSQVHSQVGVRVCILSEVREPAGRWDGAGPHLVVPLVRGGAPAAGDADAKAPSLPHDGECQLETERTGYVQARP